MQRWANPQIEQYTDGQDASRNLLSIITGLAHLIAGELVPPYVARFFD